MEKYQITKKLLYDQPFGKRITKMCEKPNAFLDYKINRVKILEDYAFKREMKEQKNK